jgi:hypothetical protein
MVSHRYRSQKETRVPNLDRCFAVFRLAQRCESRWQSGNLRSRSATPEASPTDIMALLRGYELSLRARNRSPKTIVGYLQTVGVVPRLPNPREHDHRGRPR